PSYTMEKRYVRKDGSLVWINLTVALVRETSGEPKYFISVVENISERKHAEEALRRAEQKYRSIFENALEGIFQTRLDGRFVASNPALARMLGYASPEELMTHVTDVERQLFVDPEQRAELMRLIKEHGVVKGFEATF